ncbi:MAG: cobalamin B12-binding domain-containing protein [Candidatus Eremiobacteraeota bacterium]|nr:cobalamin B12-binding domain-containing protein [Candidatus Eremiobacteraeota bacterium]
MDAIKNFDIRAAEHSLIAAALVLPNDEFVLNVLAPLLRKVGEAWSSGDFGVSQEHLLSQLVRNLTGSLALQQSYTENVAEPIVFATPPGEQHEFGIALSALLAARSGFTIANLGPSLPAEDIARAARMLHAQTIVLGSMAPALDRAVPAFLRSLIEAVPVRIEVWLGGPNAAALCKKSAKTRLRAFSTFEEFAQQLRRIHAGGGA